MAKNSVTRSPTLLSLALALSAAACGPSRSDASTQPTATAAPAASQSEPAPDRETVISVVGTNDLHGRVQALPLLGGYVAKLRADRSRDGGVLLVDAGDMFQGTLESNLLEGSPVRDAYGALGYAAVAVGNHEFDFGPLGPHATPQGADDDRRGALKALAQGALFPFLMANVLDRASGQRVDWPNMPASVLVEVAGVKIGLLGVTSIDTPTTTISSNVDDLVVEPLGAAIEREAKALRSSGASAVVVLAHAGGKCKRFTRDADKDECDAQAEIFDVARKLPPKTVDLIVAGHTHAGLAHEINGVPIIEQHHYGRAFGRVDLVFRGHPAQLTQHRLHEPRDLCPGSPSPDFSSCDPGEYEGARITRDEAVAQKIKPGLDAARDRRAHKIGPEVEEPIRRSYDAESALGNLFADLLLDSEPGADVALVNGGGLRQDFPKGTLLYSSLFESFPFDNQVATVSIKASALRQLLSDHLQKNSGGILSIAGVRVRAECAAGGTKLDVKLTRNNKPLRDDDTVRLVASDFMLLGGDAFWGSVTRPKLTVTPTLMRDALERGLARRKTLRSADSFDEKKPRISAPSRRPVRCGP